MTREESLSIITEAIEDYVCNYVTDTAKAQKMLNAIQTLEQEPCDDCISRQAVLETLDDMDNVLDEDRTIENYKELLKECYEVLPSVKPQESIGHCKDCKYFEYDSVAKVNGIPLIVAHEICSRWGDGCKTKEDGYCFMFEPQESEK